MNNSTIEDLKSLMITESQEGLPYEPVPVRGNIYPLTLKPNKSGGVAMSESGTWTQYQKLVLKLLEQHDEKLEALRHQVTSSAQDRAVIVENVKTLKEEVDLLLLVVRDGTIGAPAVLSRMETIELELKGLREVNEEKKAELASIKTWKRSFIIALVGVGLNILWNLAQQFFVGK